MVLAVPRWQVVQVEEERVVAGHIARVDDGVEIAAARGLDSLKGRQQRVPQAIAHRLPVVADELCQFAVAAEGILRRQTGLHTVLHRIVAQIDMVAQERLDLPWRRILLPPRFLVATVPIDFLGPFGPFVV